MAPASVLLEGLMFGESPRWHDDSLWVCDWGAQQLLRVSADGDAEVVARVQSFPFCIDWLPQPDGRLLAVSAADKAVLAIADDGTLQTFCALDRLAPAPPNNEIVVHPAGHVYVDGGGFDLGAGEAPAPGYVALIAADGSSARLVADGIEFGNGMAITEDGSTLIVAESYGRRLSAFTIGADGELSDRRVWAELETARRTESASTPPVRSGTRTCPTAAACGSWRAVWCSTRSGSTVAASPACWEATTVGRSTWSRVSGTAGPRCVVVTGPVRC